MPFGLLLDLRECNLQYHGITKPLIEADIDSVIPAWL